MEDTLSTKRGVTNKRIPQTINGDCVSFYGYFKEENQTCVITDINKDNKHIKKLLEQFEYYQEPIQVTTGNTYRSDCTTIIDHKYSTVTCLTYKEEQTKINNSLMCGRVQLPVVPQCNNTYSLMITGRTIDSSTIHTSHSNSELVINSKGITTH